VICPCFKRHDIFHNGLLRFMLRDERNEFMALYGKIRVSDLIAFRVALRIQC
jgi:hypothetical protein